MTTWLIIFGITLMVLVVLHGLRQQQIIGHAPRLATDASSTPGESSLLSAGASDDSHPSPEPDVALVPEMPEALTPRQRAVANHHFAHHTANPWMFCLQLDNASWSLVAVSLAKQQAAFDEQHGAYHVFDGDTLQFSVVAAGALCDTGLPSPADISRLQENIEGLWLALPVKHREDMLTAFEAMARFAFGFMQDGHRLEDADGNVIDGKSLEAWHQFFQ